MPLAARKAVELVEEIWRNISLFHRNRRSADESAEKQVWLVGVGPAQKAWMSGTGKEQVKPEERWQRCSDQAREILAAMQRGRDRGGEERGATSSGGSSTETVQVLGRRGQDLPRLQNVMDLQQVVSRPMLAAGSHSVGSVVRGWRREDLWRPAVAAAAARAAAIHAWGRACVGGRSGRFQGEIFFLVCHSVTMMTSRPVRLIGKHL